MFTNFINWLKNLGQELFTNVSTAAQAIEPAVVSSFDALVHKYTPIAVAQAQTAETAFTTGSEKASAVKTGLIQALETDGQNIAADGFDAFVNLLVEIGATTVKLMSGTVLKATS